jgi:hypothetical protein
VRAGGATSRNADGRRLCSRIRRNRCTRPSTRARARARARDPVAESGIVAASASSAGPQTPIAAIERGNVGIRASDACELMTFIAIRCSNGAINTAITF